MLLVLLAGEHATAGCMTISKAAPYRQLRHQSGASNAAWEPTGAAWYTQHGARSPASSAGQVPAKGVTARARVGSTADGSGSLDAATVASISR